MLRIKNMGPGFLNYNRLNKCEKPKNYLVNPSLNYNNEIITTVVSRIREKERRHFESLY
jgi:hypothetical protein